MEVTSKLIGHSRIGITQSSYDNVDNKLIYEFDKHNKNYYSDIKHDINIFLC